MIDVMLMQALMGAVPDSGALTWARFLATLTVSTAFAIAEHHHFLLTFTKGESNLTHPGPMQPIPLAGCGFSRFRCKSRQTSGSSSPIIVGSSSETVG